MNIVWKSPLSRPTKKGQYLIKIQSDSPYYEENIVYTNAIFDPEDQFDPWSYCDCCKRGNVVGWFDINNLE